MDSIRPIDPRDRNPEQFLRVERLREERDPPERKERREPRDEPDEGSLIDVRV